ncbi:proton-conducting membrane transporter [Luteococcus peritonei]|uniref:NADH-quinone oxidoreductase subunit B n=1 Tax=Luteococcus peritonei TaxID=88874 RepID=A0ABW4RVY4_9ACTN
MPHAVVDWFGDQSVVVVDLALACCAIESEFAVPAGAPRLAAVPDGARVVAVVSGTLTDALAGLVARSLAALPDAHVVSFGACACAGGPYWDAGSVTKGVDQLVAVDTYIAGCPPPPEALARVVEQVREEVLAHG